ncbi:CAP domain-containing protein [Rubinisphaera italica]|uniref:Cysteine-rich secretory protein family protein n=1 Tax=Rubinisphaera italica TaxID=2527969 RepID=A0A5C5XF28_9PLAN|nr:CAP domain-containing protein [Rubinisphaera italica]TWT60755.1 Cysteine-rich secretory protein family protein [Rubinisphaera italica]
MMKNENATIRINSWLKRLSRHSSQSLIIATVAMLLASSSTALAQTEQQQLLNMINQERAKQNMQPLAMNDKLTKAAQDWSKYMADNDYFNHLSPDGTTPQQRAQQAGYPDFSGWENIYAGGGDLGKPANTFDGWMNSPGHKANMLKADLNEVGLGVAVNSTGVKYWTLLAGIGKNVKAPMANKPIAAPAKMDWEDKNTQFSGGPIMVVGVPNLATFGKPDPTRKGFQSLIYNGVLRADRKYTIETKSTDFNTYLELKNINGKEASAANGRPNAVLEFQPKANGTYQLKASSFQAGATGQLEVWITSNPAN